MFECKLLYLTERGQHNDWCHCQWPCVALTATNHTNHTSYDGLAIRHRNNSACCMWQSLSGSDTLAGLWLSVTAVSSASDCYRGTRQSPPLLTFGIIIGARMGLPAFHWHWTNTSLSPSLSSRRCDQYIVQSNLLPPRQESVNFCFTLCLFRGKKENFKWRIHQTEEQIFLIWLWMQWTYMALNFKSWTWK